jgi:hypothetical protein
MNEVHIKEGSDMCASVHPLDHMFNLKTNEWILVKFDIK